MHPFVPYFCIRQGAHKPFGVSSSHCQVQVTLYGVSLHVDCTLYSIFLQMYNNLCSLSYYDVPVFDNKSIFELSWVEYIMQLVWETIHKDVQQPNLANPARYGFKIVQSLWNLTGSSAAVLPSHLSTFRTIWPWSHRISRPRGLAISYGKTNILPHSYLDVCQEAQRHGSDVEHQHEEVHMVVYTGEVRLGAIMVQLLDFLPK